MTKTLALADVLACELDARLERLRALVLCDTEVARRPSEALVGVLRPRAGAAPEVVRTLAADPRTAVARPLLVSGRGLRCTPDDAGHLLDAQASVAGGSGSPLTGWRADPDGDGLVRLAAAGPEWRPRRWVPLATGLLEAGETRVLVGTRALLGEGWDAPCVNCLVDLTMATTGVSVRQLRGRSLRLDPGDPGKIASNWDVVCVAPDRPDGAGDYDRFARKHDHLYAPSEDGQLEAGPTHVHPALGPFAPPPPAAFAAINRDVAARARDYERARARWRIGAPYRGEERDTLVVRARVARTPRPSPRPRRPSGGARRRRRSSSRRATRSTSASRWRWGAATAAVGGALAASCFTHRTEAGRDALALAGSQPVDYETSTRKVWV